MLMRNPDQTRKTLLEAAYAEIERHGFQATSLADILAHTGLTKGALYHHFPNKLALGYAVVDEVIREKIVACWVTPLTACENPIDALLGLLQKAAQEMGQECAQNGCPLNNLAQEMSQVDEGFRQRISDIYTVWRRGIGQALAQGQSNGSVRTGINADVVATFIVAAIEGCIGMAKNARDVNLLFECGAGLQHYLETLRPPGRAEVPHQSGTECGRGNIGYKGDTA